MHDFNLHAPEGANKRKRAIGRGQGSGRGTTAGKGNKGQHSRSGGKTYLGFEGGQMPLYRRLAHRGFSNYLFKKPVQIVNLGRIELHYADGEVVNHETLLRKGLISNFVPVKVLADGNFAKKLTFAIDAVSEAAKVKIAKAGGLVTLVSSRKVSGNG